MARRRLTAIQRLVRSVRDRPSTASTSASPRAILASFNYRAIERRSSQILRTSPRITPRSAVRVRRLAKPNKTVADQLRELAERIERDGIHDATFETKDQAFFKKGEDMEMVSITRVKIDLKILRHA